MESTIQEIGQHTTGQHINLKLPERYISVIAGVKIGFSGFKGLFKNPVSSLIKIGTGGYLLNRGITGHCELYNMAGKTSTEPVVVAINTSVMIDKPRHEVYEFWRKLDNLPLFMSHLKSVELLGDGQSKWTLKLPVDLTDISWEAQIVDDMPGELISWGSVPDAMIETFGQVRFMDTTEPGVTMVHVNINYQPPAGGLGAGVANLLNPVFQKMVEDDVLNFKRFMDISSVVDDIADENASTDELVVIELVDKPE